MIASNYRKHPEALALQWPLPFSRLLVWALPRPTTRILRAIRVARGAAFKLAGHIAYPVKASTPQWVKDAARKARQLAASVKAALMPLALNNTKEEAQHARDAEELKTADPYRKRILIMRMQDREANIFSHQPRT